MIYIERKRMKKLLPAATWTFLTNHAHVLVCVSKDPEILMRDIAQQVGITERAVQNVVGELVDAGYLVRERDGRRNHYEVRGALPLRHPIERHRQVRELIALVQGRSALGAVKVRGTVRKRSAQV